VCTRSNSSNSPKGPRLTTRGDQANAIFHVDSSFNPRRAGYSLLRAHELPPKGTGGNTLYADTRTAWDELDPALKAELVDKSYIASHSLWHSRKVAAPDFFSHIVPENYPFSRHRLIQRHEPSGRMNLYIASHVHHIEGLPEAESKALFDKLYQHAQQPRYVLEVQWQDPGDLIVWDNTCVMHRAGSGSFEGKYRRDMRRTTVHDGSSQAWGLNEHSDVRQGLP
jgi:alpha-ketoglutarate-dependent 2,4-dichlorophenoxyacetate dioxygenase